MGQPLVQATYNRYLEKATDTKFRAHLNVGCFGYKETSAWLNALLLGYGWMIMSYEDG